ncbi:MAG: DUF4245 domain-containing protein [Actinomycetota bacterium]|nr:DUF4245 domain-containing protein [Actinomycetota bacterium]
MTEQTGPPPRKSFAEQSFGDLLRSLFLLLLVVGVVWAVSSVVSPDDQARRVEAVDYSRQLAAAREAADHPVLAPRGLPAGWVPTSVSSRGRGGSVRWHLGFLSPQHEYVGLEQAGRHPQALVRRYVGGLARVGTVAVGGVPWRVYAGETDTALVHREGDRVTVVVGTAEAGVLEAFARSLAG